MNGLPAESSATSIVGASAPPVSVTPTFRENLLDCVTKTLIKYEQRVKP